jgi:formylglycine-generating enzyme required for sulfatase activity
MGAASTRAWAVLLLAACSAWPAPKDGMSAVPAGTWRNPFPGKVAEPPVRVAPFRMDIRPVTVSEFHSFLRAHPEWGKGRVRRLFADSGYLASWPGDGSLPAGQSNRAVTQVSWYAAKAYCADRGKRLPSTMEWERAALEVPPGLDSAAYAARSLEWYGKPAGSDSAPGALAGRRHAFGLQDLLGTVWEWTTDFNALGPVDRGEASAKDDSFFCGGAAGSALPGTAYAVFMRYAFRGSLKPDFTLPTLGFRCARDP